MCVFLVARGIRLIFHFIFIGKCLYVYFLRDRRIRQILKRDKTFLLLENVYMRIFSGIGGFAKFRKQKVQPNLEKFIYVCVFLVARGIRLIFHFLSKGKFYMCILAGIGGFTRLENQKVQQNLEKSTHVCVFTVVRGTRQICFNHWKITMCAFSQGQVDSLDFENRKFMKTFKISPMCKF